MISLDDILEKDASKGLAKQKKQLDEAFADQGIVFHTMYEFGTLKFLVEDLHKEGDADVVVMGTTGASGLKELLIGSNAAAVIDSAECPVITVPPNTKTVAPVRIVLAADLKETHRENVLGPLVTLATKLNAEVCVAHVTNAPEADFEPPALDQLLPGVTATFKLIVASEAAAGIDGFLQDYGADMLVMVPHTLGFFEGLFHRSVTRKMSMHSNVPMLTLRD